MAWWLQHLNSLLIASPWVGVILLLLWPSFKPMVQRTTALLFSLLPLALWIHAAWSFRGVGGFELAEYYPWVSVLGFSYWVGLDGVSLLLVGMTVVGVPLALWVLSLTSSSMRRSVICILALESFLIGAFSAIDLLLFYIFIELASLTVLFLAMGAQVSRAIASARYFLVVQAIGSILFLFLLCHLALSSGGTLNLAELSLSPLAENEQGLWFGIFVIALFAKMAYPPFHGTLKKMLLANPEVMAWVYVALFTKAGLYALWRFGLPLFPVSFLSYGWVLSILGLLGICYGTLLAVTARNLKEVVAYVTMAHMGLILMGLMNTSQEAVEGAFFQMVHHAVIVAALALFLTEARAKTSMSINRYADVAWMLCFFLLLASAGMPGSSGFVGAWLILWQAWVTSSSMVTVAVLSLGVLSCALIYWLHRARDGKTDDNMNLFLSRPRLLVGTSLLLVTLVAGLQPELILHRSRSAVATWRTILNKATTESINSEGVLRDAHD